jgi:hypothetical protein
VEVVEAVNIRPIDEFDGKGWFFNRPQPEPTAGRGQRFSHGFRVLPDEERVD